MNKYIFLVALGYAGGYATGYVVKAHEDIEQSGELHDVITQLSIENSSMRRTLTYLDRIITNSQKTIEDAYVLCGGVASILPVPPPESRGTKRREKK